MKKNTSQEAYYERLRNLGDVNKKSIKESQNRSLGTLIDYKRAVDGVAYGIIKENHHYYVKKAGLKQDPNVSDFAYINGLANITNYQYKSLAEADKQRNMLLHVINEAVSTKVSKTGSKKRLNEDKVSDEIEQAEEKLDAAETAVDVPAEEPMGDMGGEMPTPDGEEMSAEEMPTPDGGEELPAEEPAPEGGSEMPAPDGGEEMPAGEEGSEMPAEEPTGEEGSEELPAEEPTGEEGDEEGTKDEIKSEIGKIGEKLLQKTLNDKQVISYVNMFLGYFKDNFLNMEQNELDDMAARINELHKEKNIKDLEQNTPTEPIDIENPEGVEESQCSECGGFAQYAESRGYTKESLMECGEEEMGSLVGGYASAYGDGENEGDHKTVALFIKLMPKVLDILKNEYGHEDYANELEPEVNSLSESTEEDIRTQIEEALGGALWGGLKSVGKGIGQAVAAPVKGAYQMGKQAGQAVGQAVNKGIENVKQAAAAQSQKQDIRTGTKKRNAYLDKVQAKASELTQLIQQANAGATKAGQEPINVGSVLSTLRNQLAGSGNVDLSKYKAEGVEEVTNTEILPENQINFAPAGQSLGAGVVKPEGAPVTTEPVNEVVKKLRETIDTLVNEAKGGNKVPFTKGAKIVKEEKPSAGLTKEKKSEVVKAAKKGEDIGKKGKGFKEVEKKAKESGATDPKAVAAAAMWKNVKKEGVEEQETISKSEQKLRKYIRKQLEEKAGLRKPVLTESKKSDNLKKLDEMIDKQYKLYESIVKKKVNEEVVDESMFGKSKLDKFKNLNLQNEQEVNDFFRNMFSHELTGQYSGAFNKAFNITPLEKKYNILKQYFENNSTGTIARSNQTGQLVYAKKSPLIQGGGLSGKGFNSGY